MVAVAYCHVSWIDQCRGFARAQALDPEVVEPLLCFAGPDPRGGSPAPPELPAEASFAALEARWEGRLRLPELPSVDAAQGAMFGRRLAAVDDLLAGLAKAGPRGRLLRLGLRVRLAGIAAAEPPRALRVRALADFYYSLAVAAEHHASGGDRLPSIVDGVAGADWTDLGGGLRFARWDGPCREGPQVVHLLSVDPERARVRAVDVRDDPRPFPEVVAARGARAGTSGGFFLYSEPDIDAPSGRYDPVGLLVSEGRVLGPPTFRRGALTLGRRTSIARVGPEGWTLTIQGRSARIATAWNRADRAVGPDRPTVAVVGDRVVAAGRSLPVPLNGVVVPWWPVAAGARVAWTPPEPMTTAMAGGPMLRRGDVPVLDHRAEDFHRTAPPRTFSQDETGDRNLLPRLAVGRRADGVLVFAAVDGRRPTRALGLTLRATGAMLGALGCPDVLNLDGGSSKRMVVDGAAVDVATTEVGPTDGPPRVRPVHTALLFGGP